LRDVRALFESPDWRPHVVASTALVMGLASAPVRAAAWRCLGEGSWASPQIVAALLLTDSADAPTFVRDARSRLEACRMQDAKEFGALVAALARETPGEATRYRDHWLPTAARALAEKSPAMGHEKRELEVGREVFEHWLGAVLARTDVRGRLAGSVERPGA
jgi:plasmid stabilization system protein ParE